MQITTEIEDEVFNLEISIENYGHFKPANLDGHPDNRTAEEYEPLEFKIESATHKGGPVEFTASAWRNLSTEDKVYYNEIEVKRIQLKNNDLSKEEYSRILEAIRSELEE